MQQNIVGIPARVWSGRPGGGLGFIPPRDFFFFLTFKLLGVGWDGVHLARQPLTGLLYQSRMIDDECGAVGEMRIGRRSRSTWRKPTPVPLCSPQIQHDLIWAGTRAAVVGSWRLTACAMAQPQQRSSIMSILGLGPSQPPLQRDRGLFPRG
jgi:hypothetical protein